MAVAKLVGEITEYQPRFRTFANYYRAWDILFHENLGECPQTPLVNITGHRKYSTLHRNAGLSRTVTTCMRNAWATETLLHLLATMPAVGTGVAVTKYSCAWAPAQGYYAVYSALLAAADAVGQSPHPHKGTLSFASSLVTAPGNDWIPAVFNYWYRGIEAGNTVFSPSMITPDCCSIHNLSRPQTSAQALALVKLCLRTTRRQQCEEQAARRRGSNRGKLRGVTKADRAAADSELRATTLFDYLYRLRCRCNYRDTDMFVFGSTIGSDSAAFLKSVESVVGYCLCILETILWLAVARTTC